jgi:peptidoglycan/LPS O-acetylase OafA/YrhL
VRRRPMMAALSGHSTTGQESLQSTKTVVPPTCGDVAHRKLTELDALRGLAAIIVFSGHFCEGLVPAVTASINGTLLFVALNGPAAVIVFFVLSGFVLTLRPLHARRWIPLVVLALKRWPRLAGPVAMAGLLYSVAAMIGAFPRPEILATVPLPHAPAYLFWGQAQHNEQLGKVLHEAMLGTFLSESAQHNGVLWTMHWEFLGSFLAVGLAAIVMLKLPIALRAAIFATLWAAAATFSPWLVAFPLGVIGAVLHGTFGTRIRITNWLATGMLLCGAMLLSWDIRVQAGIWAWTGVLTTSSRFLLWVAAESVAAGLCMAVALYNPAARRWLSSPLGSLSGRVSFSFYLVHLLVLCSFSSWLYIWVVPMGPGVWAGMGLFCASIAASFVLAILLMIFDQWWIRVLGRTIRPITLPS